MPDAFRVNHQTGFGQQFHQLPRPPCMVEMNMGQVCQMVKTTVRHPERVFLANRIDGAFIAPTDIRNILRLIEGKGV